MKQTNQNLSPEEVIDKYADMVYRLALLRVKNQSDADDVFQEVFIRLVSNIQKLQNEEHVKAWLIRVTINCSKKHFARYKNQDVFSMEDLEQTGAEEEGYAQAEGKGPVFLAVQKLPLKYRSVVHLFYYEEMSVQEIAETTRQKETTVKSQLFRAREMLKEMLKGEVCL